MKWRELLSACTPGFADFEDCFRMFNPLDRGTFDAVVDAWAGAVLRLVLMMPSHPAVQRDLPDLCARAWHPRP